MAGAPNLDPIRIEYQAYHERIGAELTNVAYAVGHTVMDGVVKSLLTEPAAIYQATDGLLCDTRVIDRRSLDAPPYIPTVICSYPTSSKPKTAVEYILLDRSSLTRAKLSDSGAIAETCVNGVLPVLEESPAKLGLRPGPQEILRGGRVLSASQLVGRIGATYRTGESDVPVDAYDFAWFTTVLAYGILSQISGSRLLPSIVTRLKEDYILTVGHHLQVGDKIVRP